MKSSIWILMLSMACAQGRAPATHTAADDAAAEPTGKVIVHYWNAGNLGFGHTAVEVRWDQPFQGQLKANYWPSLGNAIASKRQWGTIWDVWVNPRSAADAAADFTPASKESYFSYAAWGFATYDDDESSYGELTKGQTVEFPQQSLKALQDAMTTPEFAVATDPKQYKFMSHNCAHVTMNILRFAGIQLSLIGGAEPWGLTPWRVFNASRKAAKAAVDMQSAARQTPDNLADRDPNGGDPSFDPSADRVETGKAIDTIVESSPAAADTSADEGGPSPADASSSSGSGDRVSKAAR